MKNCACDKYGELFLKKKPSEREVFWINRKTCWLTEFLKRHRNKEVGRLESNQRTSFFHPCIGQEKMGNVERGVSRGIPVPGKC